MRSGADFARPEDLAELHCLWRECFDESGAVFFRCCFDRCLPLVWREEGRPVAMLFLLPCQMEGRAYWYLYGAGTAKAFRRQGLMAALMERAKQETSAQNKAGIILLPANPSLYGFYQKLGFVTAFFQKTGVLKQEQLPGTPCPEEEGSLSWQELWDARRQSLPRSAVLFPPWYLQFAQELYTSFGGGLIAFGQGYLLYDAQPDRVLIKEMVGSEQELYSLLRILQTKAQRESYVLEVPEDSILPFGATFQTRPHGMIWPGEGQTRGYLSFALD